MVEEEVEVEVEELVLVVLVLVLVVVDPDADDVQDSNRAKTHLLSSSSVPLGK